MARKPGTPNKASFQKPGQMKTNFIKFRVSNEWLDTMKKVKEAKPFWFDGRTDAQIYRWLILEGAIKFCRDLGDDMSLQDIVQQQIENT